MSKEAPYRDQAERLRKKVNRNWKTDEVINDKEALPPRSRLHREKRKKNKWKVKYPIIRLLAILFILLPITVFSIYNYSQKEPTGGTEADTPIGFETIGFEADDEDRENEGDIDYEEGIIKEDKEDLEDTEGNAGEKAPSIPASKTPVLSDAEDKGTKGESDSVKEQQDYIYHTVQPNENMFRIALKYYNSQAGIEIIKTANNLKNNEIQVGQVLKIPKK